MKLDPATKRRYLRQLLLSEIGESGQARLLATEFCRGADCGREEYDVAAEYLRRAGCTESDSFGSPVHARVEGTVKALVDELGRGTPAAAVIGALSAVEHLKQSLSIGRPLFGPRAGTTKS